MYENIGGKIKQLAKGCFFVESIAAIIAGFNMNINGSFFYGFLLFILGPLVAYVLSWLLYGFGQFIENTDKIVEAQNKIIKAQVNTKINTDKLVSALYENKNQ